jgi:hypothetical protein
VQSESGVCSFVIADTNRFTLRFFFTTLSFLYKTGGHVFVNFPSMLSSNVQHFWSCLKKLLCYHDNDFNTSRSENTMVLSARVSACMYFLVSIYILTCFARRILKTKIILEKP